MRFRTGPLWRSLQQLEILYKTNLRITTASGFIQDPFGDSFINYTGIFVPLR